MTRKHFAFCAKSYKRVGKAERGPAAGAVFDWGTFLKFE